MLLGERACANHAAKRSAKPKPRCGIVDQMRHAGDQRVPDGTVEFIHTRTLLWRREIVQARIRLADEGLTYAQRAELWRIVDYREWCLQMLVRDFPAELERIDREIEHELRR
jgi:hypothetical protein